MEFWGVEVPSGKPTSCHPGDGMYLHVSQAALGESKDKSVKGNARVVLKVKVDEDGSEVVLGTLSEGKCDQMPLDLVFDREFVVSHNGASSVYICGYRTEGPEYDDSEEEEEDEEEEDEDMPVPIPIVSNGAAEVKQIKASKVEEVVKKAEEAAKKALAAVKDQKKGVKKQVVESSSDEEDESDDEDEGMGNPFVSDLASESDDEFDAGDDSDEDMDEDDDDEDDEDDDEDESDESEEEELKIEAPKPGKKRAAEALIKPADKKSKTDASGKPGQSPGKKEKEGKGAPASPVGKAAAPAEVKTPTDKGTKAAKAPKGTPTAPPTTPVSEKKIGQHKCTGCDRTFVSESAMTQHATAKHKA